MADYQRQSNKFLLRGTNIALPSDRLTKEWAQVLRNVRIYVAGEVRQRPGLALLGDLDPTVAGAVTWATHMGDPATLPAFRRLYGTTAGRVYVDDAAHTSFTLADNGYDNGGFSHIRARPDRSPAPYWFVANEQRQSKFTALGERSNWGLSAPLAPPVVELLRPAYRLIDDFSAIDGFAASGGTASLQSRINAITISQILYDQGTTGWACVAPASMDEAWQEGAFVTTSANIETVPIESIYQAIAPTTIAAIAYDSGSNGPCTIQLSVPTDGLQRNSLLRLNNAENVRVLSVTRSLDNIPSIRCSTVGTFSAGQSVVGFRSFRAWFANNHTAGETLSTSYLQLAVTGAGIASLAKIIALDLSSTNAGANRPIQGEDFIHISLLVADWSLITEIQLQVDIDAATNTFAENYYYTSIRPPDLLASIQQTSSSLTAQQQEMQRRMLDAQRQSALQALDAYNAEKARLLRDLSFATPAYRTYLLERLAALERANQPLLQAINSGAISQGQGPITSEAASGAQQWTEVLVPVSGFERVGSDTSRGWKDVQAFRITVNATAAVNVGMDALWIGGTYGPDTREAASGIIYCYVARNSTTGSESNASPPTRSPVLPQREGVTGSIPAGYADPQADVFDVYRIGGTLGEYHYVLTAPAGSPNFIDTLPDDVVSTQKILQFDRFQPWPVPDRPRSGIGTVVGTRFIRTSGDLLNPDWAAGTQIIINDRTYTFYSQPDSAQTVELSQSAGSQIGVRWEIPEPLLVGQPLPVVFGPYSGGGSGEFFFACGDRINPGYLYFCNGNDPESASDENILEVCPPEEKLMAGGVLDGIVYVFSDRRSWRILPSFNQGASGAGSLFYHQQTAMGKGLAGRYAITFGDRIYWVSYDGIWTSRGDSIESLTDDSLAPLFRRDGSGYNQTLGGLVPISFAEEDERYHHLTYSRDGLYHDYRGVDGNFYTNFYSFLTQGWFADRYNDPITFTLREEGPYTDTIIRGSGSGRVYNQLATQFSDSGAAIQCAMVTGEEDWGDSRAEKLVGDQMIDLDPAGQSVAASLQLNNNTSSADLAALTGSVRSRLIRDLNGGLGIYARSAALSLSWLGSSGITKVYEWQPSALIKPELMVRRASDWDTAGYEGPKWLQGMRLKADTQGVAKEIQVQYDQDRIVANLTITHNGEVTREYSWPPVVAHQMRIIGLDDDQWRMLGVEWIAEPEPGLAGRWQTQFTNLDLRGYWHIRDLLIAHRSFADLTLTVGVDGVSYTYLIPGSGGQRVRTYLAAQAVKGKYAQLIVTSSLDFALYLKDVEIRAKPWGSTGGYQTFRPFGDLSRATGDGGGARI